MTRIIVDIADVETVAATMRQVRETLAGVALDVQRGWDQTKLNDDLDRSVRVANPHQVVSQTLADLRRTQDEIIADITELERVVSVLRADEGAVVTAGAQATTWLDWDHRSASAAAEAMPPMWLSVGGSLGLGLSIPRIVGLATTLARSWDAAPPPVQPFDWAASATSRALDWLARDVEQVMTTQASFTDVQVEIGADLSFGSFLKGLGGFFTSLWDRGKALADALKAYTAELWDSALSKLSGIGDTVNQELDGLLARAQQLFQGPPSDFEERLGEVTPTNIQGALDRLGAAFDPTIIDQIKAMIPEDVLGLLEREGKLDSVIALVEQHGPSVVASALAQLGLEAVDKIIARFGEDGLQEMITLFVGGHLATLLQTLGKSKLGVLMENLGPAGVQDLLGRMSAGELGDALDSITPEHLKQLAAAFGVDGASGLIDLIQSGQFEELLLQLGEDKLLYLIDRVGPDGLKKALATYSPDQIKAVLAWINPKEVGKAFDDLLAAAGPEDFDKLVGYVLHKSGLAGYRKTGEFNTGFEESFAASFTSDHMYLEFEARLRASLSASGSFEITGEGIELGGKVAVFFGADAAASAGFDVGPIEGEGTAMAAIAAGGEAKGKATIGIDGIDADVSAEAFAGARARIDGRIGSDVLGAGGSAGVLAGIGASLDANLKVGWDEVSFGFDMGASLGIGAEFSFDVNFNPEEIMNDVQGYVSGMGDRAVEYAETTINEFVTQPIAAATEFASSFMPDTDIDIGWPF